MVEQFVNEPRFGLVPEFEAAEPTGGLLSMSRALGPGEAAWCDQLQIAKTVAERVECVGVVVGIGHEVALDRRLCDQPLGDDTFVDVHRCDFASGDFALGIEDGVEFVAASHAVGGAATLAFGVAGGTADDQRFAIDHPEDAGLSRHRHASAEFFEKSYDGRAAEAPRHRGFGRKRLASEGDWPVLSGTGPGGGSVVNDGPVEDADDFVVLVVVVGWRRCLVEGEEKCNNRHPELVFHDQAPNGGTSGPAMNTNSFAYKAFPFAMQ